MTFDKDRPGDALAARPERLHAPPHCTPLPGPGTRWFPPPLPLFTPAQPDGPTLLQSHRDALTSATSPT
ncbi:hypothetical protein ABZ498_27480 [Streptomyces lavendulocolor]|uniref:hypothetical protein n=1 Tax=Streptomyces lavendulocolor TaxID=67316 RepID=UPI003410438F